MGALAVIEHQNQRVLTTAQLAESYGTDADRIHKNFSRNQERYKPKKHYVLLQGNELRAFRATGQIDLSPNLNKLYLWTEKGAWMHAKSLNTDQAWDAYELLVDEYYRVRDAIKPTESAAEIILMLAQENANKEKRLALVEQKVEEVEHKIVARMTLDYYQQSAILNAKVARVEYLWAKGEYNPEIHSTKKKLHAQAWTDIKRVFGVSSYRDIRQSHFEEAMKYIQSWRPRLI